MAPPSADRFRAGALSFPPTTAGMEGQLIEGKRIIVTGGASGMGLTLVKGYARHGAHVVSLDIDPTGAAIAEEALARHDAEQARKRVIGGKLGDPERDFLPMMIFLASDGANYLTGQTYKIDGGGLMLS